MSSVFSGGLQTSVKYFFFTLTVWNVGPYYNTFKITEINTMAMIVIIVSNWKLWSHIPMHKSIQFLALSLWCRGFIHFCLFVYLFCLAIVSRLSFKTYKHYKHSQTNDMIFSVKCVFRIHVFNTKIPTFWLACTDL